MFGQLPHFLVQRGWSSHLGLEWVASVCRGVQVSQDLDHKWGKSDGQVGVCSDVDTIRELSVEKKLKELSFLQEVAGLSLRDKVRSSAFQEV